MQYTALSSSKHTDLKLRKRTFFHVQNQPMVPLSVAEASRAALDLPLAFNYKLENKLSLVAIISLEKGDTPFLNFKGRWVGGYMPAVINCHPFALAFKEDKGVVVVEEGNEFLSTTEGQSLFDEEGNPTEFLDKITNLLKKYYPNPNRDNPVLEAIQKADILEPWSDISENLLRVDTKKLSELDDAGFLELRQKNVLPVIYAQLMSMRRINRIKNLAERKQKMQPQEVDVDKLFGGESDIISFDNI